MTKSKSTSIRLDLLHQQILDKTLEHLESEGIKTNQTDVFQKALYSFAKERFPDLLADLLDKHHSEFN